MQILLKNIITEGENSQTFRPDLWWSVSGSIVWVFLFCVIAELGN